MATATTEPVRLPPALRLPKMVQAVLFLTALQYRVAPRLSRHYGGPFTINLPVFGKTVVIHDRDLVKDVFSTSFDLIERPTKVLGQAFGPGSTFSLLGKEHSERRKLVLPNFQGRRLKNYEQIVEDEVLRETAKWPEGKEFETLSTMTNLTLNAIMRATFGERADALDELRVVIPPLITLGSLMQRMPPIVRGEYGRWSPGSRLAGYRRRFDAVIDELIAEARADIDALPERGDMLALLLQVRYEDGQPISDRHIADELLTLVAAGHETTASQLAWAVERLRRHPRLLSRLTEEVDAGGSELRQATIYEVQRLRSTIAASLRTTKTKVRLGEWVLPADTNVMVDFQLAHESDVNYTDPETFNPDRFIGTTPPSFRWLPFGGGINRCVGAAFANMEMDITLRTLLREFRFAPTDAPDEGRNFRGVAIAPSKGALAVVYRRPQAKQSDRDSVAVADHSS
ncbi:cytochrome P450 [Mycobacterium cookii]|uniref:Putative cytochrome P450 138 n=1 Tax=Mycobacterium cookii TaxID=1775 RepID=A0A7I7KVE9_9MYCO|nr:cytochrome P450 [Mycobacterium cookii]MCV7331441.1 cytochrome P450 [Mycobacterium cookii]BBX45794.1 putative cytochrome P450 138 [Mycobacterium cookii]